MRTHTSLKLSKLLAENGCKLESKYYHNLIPAHESRTGMEFYIVEQVNSNGDSIPAYDILNDLCVRHCDEFFGDNEVTHGKTSFILYLLQQGKTQDEIEDYIWKQCEFNKKEQQLIKANQ